MIKDNAVFINHARSGLVDESFLAEELKTGRFCAAIDVTDPEPPPPQHPLRGLPNVLFTPHLAGAISRNVYRNGEFAYREIKNFVEGKPLFYPVDLSQLDKIA
jgi:phosphoglycerate dehydrogenase-like enzyme